MPKLNYLAESVLADLRANVPSNLDRYRGAGFDNLADRNGWSMELSSTEFAPEKLEQLDPSGGSAAEVSNSLIVFGAFSGMTPALATEERVWTRLTHFECLEYTRKRWALQDEPKDSGGRLNSVRRCIIRTSVRLKHTTLREAGPGIAMTTRFPDCGGTRLLRGGLTLRIRRVS